MQDAADENVVALPAEEQHVAPLFVAPQPGPYMAAGATQHRHFDEAPTRRFELSELACGLGFVPPMKGVRNDSVEIGQGTIRETEGCHRFAGGTR
jgi:hypothetical protein